MSKVSDNSTKKGRTRKQAPARTPEQQQNMMMNLAMDLAEKKLKDGTASNQLICFFLKLTTMKEKLENEKLKSDLKLAEAKIDQIEKSSSSSELYAKAIDAFKRYSGVPKEDDEFEEDDYDD